VSDVVCVRIPLLYLFMIDHNIRIFRVALPPKLLAPVPVLAHCVGLSLSSFFPTLGFICYLLGARISWSAAQAASLFFSHRCQDSIGQATAVTAPFASFDVARLLTPPILFPQWFGVA